MIAAAQGDGFADGVPVALEELDAYDRVATHSTTHRLFRKGEGRTFEDQGHVAGRFRGMGALEIVEENERGMKAGQGAFRPWS